MNSINKVTLLGNLGGDPEIRLTQEGGKVVTLSLATSECWKDRQTGERREKTEWHRVVIFNENLIGLAEKYLHKGSRVLLEGSLQTRKWTDRNNMERYSTEIVLGQWKGSIFLLDRPAQESGEPYTASEPPALSEISDDNIPF
ncbi:MULTISPECIES: single-stranded DNA-binding protein [unclassified Haematospirillum]|uniref:single-stranded DNA-binding protein n=1 Tax=unclassified Haematospirillum TaxID=2622088 RepID=UPI00143C2EBB|nr:MULTISPECIES: single-stranded DNA-binding protein [unclassified Haematospirillum]NKD55147.1 single-stranded DNA-binding protein [Haematospirillum sp. H4890]NKD75400.1 single-stranded DNA-binding protein [Haematospirillum sp. H4485]